jgi:hypothetical protein
VNDVAAWAAVAVGVAGAVIAYRAYRGQRGQTRLSYVVTTSAELVPADLAAELKVSHEGTELHDPALAIVRIVSTGDVPIQATDFETELSIRFQGVAEIASATCSASRPADLRPELEVVGDSVLIRPMLVNPEDMIELQVLSAGQAHDVSIGGRVANLKVERLPYLPYPPGSGEEGEMLGFDRFMWYVAWPVIIIGIGALIAFDNDDYSELTRALIMIAAGIVAFVLYPLQLRSLVRRRRLWSPPAGDESQSSV